MSTYLSNGISVPKIYRPGLGYSPASGPQVGGLGVNANPHEYSSTFFGDNVKALFPLVGQNAFGNRRRRSLRNRRRKRKSRKSKRSKRKSRKSKRSKRKSRKSKRSKRKSRKSKRSKRKSRKRSKKRSVKNN